LIDKLVVISNVQKAILYMHDHNPQQASYKYTLTLWLNFT